MTSLQLLTCSLWKGSSLSLFICYLPLNNLWFIGLAFQNYQGTYPFICLHLLHSSACGVLRTVWDTKDTQILMKSQPVSVLWPSLIRVGVGVEHQGMRTLSRHGREDAFVGGIQPQVPENSMQIKLSNKKIILQNTTSKSWKAKVIVWPWHQLHFSAILTALPYFVGWIWPQLP